MSSVTKSKIDTYKEIKERLVNLYLFVHDNAFIEDCNDYYNIKDVEKDIDKIHTQLSRMLKREFELEVSEYI